jgi:predicted ABC-type transport system involved in lysophospholipase L1 biosynthesis ATPase subunit
MPGTIATTLTGGVAARTVDAVKRYGAGSTVVDALAGVTVAFQAGRLTAVILRQAVRELGRTIVMVTHDPVAAGSAHRVVFLAEAEV